MTRNHPVLTPYDDGGVDGSYELLPTTIRGARHPLGWVKIPTGSHTKRRVMTEGYLNTRMPRTNTIAMNQNYVTKVMDNPRTPYENRQIIINYVLGHKDKFTALCDCTEDPDHNEWARKKNGNAKQGFIREFRQKYL